MSYPVRYGLKSTKTVEQQKLPPPKPKPNQNKQKTPQNPKPRKVVLSTFLLDKNEIFYYENFKKHQWRKKLNVHKLILQIKRYWCVAPHASTLFFFLFYYWNKVQIHDILSFLPKIFLYISQKHKDIYLHNHNTIITLNKINNTSLILIYSILIWSSKFFQKSFTLGFFESISKHVHSLHDCCISLVTLLRPLDLLKKLYQLSCRIPI